MTAPFQIFLLGGLFFSLLILSASLLVRNSSGSQFRKVTALAMFMWALTVLLGFLLRTLQFQDKAFVANLCFIFGTMVVPPIATILFTLARQDRVPWKMLLLNELPFLLCFVTYFFTHEQLVCTIDHIFTVCYSVGVIVYSMLAIQRFRRKLENSYSNTESMDLKWISVVVYVLIVLLLLYETSTVIFSRPWAKLVFILSNFVIWGLVYINIMRLHAVDQAMLEESEQKPMAQTQAKTESFSAELFRMMEQEKVFTNPDLTVRSLAMMVGTNTTYLSGYLNNTLGKNFSSFVNDYRLSFAEETLLNGQGACVEDIAVRAGFNSSQTFYRLFKARNGCTPKQYMLNKGAEQS